MSHTDDHSLTVAERVLAVRQGLPPKEGRRSRHGYLNQDDFADLLGAKRTRVIAWEGGHGYPDPQNRERLAELSAGRFAPDDFAREVDVNLLVALREQVGSLSGRVAALEAAQPQGRRRDPEVQKPSDEASEAGGAE